MSGAARKARKRAGEPLVRTPKVGTPPAERAGVLIDPRTGRDRSEKQIEDRLEKLGTSAAEELLARGKWTSSFMPKIPRRIL